VLQGTPIDHVVSCLGFPKMVDTPPSNTTPDAIHDVLLNGYYQLVTAVYAFISLLKDRDGSSFTWLSGGFAHFVPSPTLWAGKCTVGHYVLQHLNIYN